MARSKIKGTNGKPVAKTKKKSTNRASIKINHYTKYASPGSINDKKDIYKNEFTETTKINDGKPTVTKTKHVYRKGKTHSGLPEVKRDPKAANPIKGKRKNARFFPPKETTTSKRTNYHKDGRVSNTKRKMGSG